MSEIKKLLEDFNTQLDRPWTKVQIEAHAEGLAGVMDSLAGECGYLEANEVDRDFYCHCSCNSVEAQLMGKCRRGQRIKKEFYYCFSCDTGTFDGSRWRREKL
ncbi:hypothetical protein LCGC14_1742260 [marine sediment metagenome]|uniref:Uncharacterized protein n=1 Tax=marine sediment metagenome TaxID=412755 RepID=A0A0F9HTX2_9ZZZZ